MFNSRNNINKKIIDTKNLDNFGVLLFDAKSIRDFQKNSGMSGEYTKEYQMHYTCAVARMNADDQILDIAIPLVMYNYEQEVTGSSVEFSGKDVNEKSNIAHVIAEKKFIELTKTKIYKKFIEMGLNKWEIISRHTLHVHPNGINSFSGVDYRKDIENPGIVYGLQDGKNIPNFSSIVQHKNNYAELIHTEYRLFNGSKKTDLLYEEGRCLTIIRGYSPPKIKERKNGLIDSIFNTKREQLEIQEPDSESYSLKKYFNEHEANDFIKEISKIWNKESFSPDQSMILKKNILFSNKKFKKNNYLENVLFKDFSNNICNTNEPEERNKNINELLNYGYTHQELECYTNKELEYILNDEKNFSLLDNKYNSNNNENYFEMLEDEELIKILVMDKYLTMKKAMSMNRKELLILINKYY